MSTTRISPSKPPAVSDQVATATQRRECFVTIGATASFRALVDATTSAVFLQALRGLGYTHLTLQCGPDLDHLERQSGPASPRAVARAHDIALRAFDFNKAGLGREMRGCKRGAGRTEGVVICHAGAGTILDAMRIDVPLIVVPNPELLDNHQAELAEELERQGYVTYGNLSSISAALEASERKSRARTAWPPVNSGERGVMDIVDQELGYETRMRETLD
ncbi:MAG: N-acetylglucosaminyldiphosphodolichol N-acetylglucosaminyltransferase catalytic subunit alg13 [Claussenomyces sp. TS43310]|nr:MAG: N-acetylglucosaminyldiphosphodolichol N-acetylglucosaminyltransferase catalytic subunit alg13 [Claussenomyces sp. TS43310]